MKRIADNVTMLILLFLYLLGLVLAKGTWETLFALAPPYAWYLGVQRFAVLLHLL